MISVALAAWNNPIPMPMTAIRVATSAKDELASNRLNQNKAAVATIRASVVR